MRKTVYDVVRLPPLVVDAVIAVGIAVLAGVFPAFAERQFGLFPLATHIAYSIALIAPLVLRRVLPVLSFTLVTLLCALQLVLIPQPMWADVAFLVSLASIARYGSPFARWGGLAVGVVGAFVGPLQWLHGLDRIHSRRDVYPMLVVLFAVLACWVLGDLRRTRADYVAELEARAVRLAAERDQQAAAAAAAERQRIAREMHDVVAHTLSVIVVQADGGRYAAESDPHAARRALDTIAASSRLALSDMRRLLGLLRAGEGGAELAPQPGVEGIPALVESVAASGLPATLDVVGEPPEVEAGVGLTVYRVVQEGLTNVMKHAGPEASAQVRVVYGERDITISVRDDGAGPATWPGRDGTGQGLAGMRERVLLHGGTLVAAGRPGGGFQVTATIPLAPVPVR